ncbi:hypothetical protein AB6A40_001425 [Gnathostoma spinigerum]|uniref:SCP domain-containing protein n=1 Tax=Gnathostoma spinigerum TaxID=75299 RepID=A0ABD6E6D5_9BILA
MPAGSSHPTHNADSTNVKMFAEQLLVAHNRLRHQHGAPSLTLSEELTEQAQQWAEKLAKRRHLAYCELPGKHSEFLHSLPFL